MMVGQGGWPLNIFLTPGDQVPFYGGTYFPVEPRYGRPGFLQVLQSVRRFYDGEKEKLQDFKQELMSALQQSTVFPTNSGSLTEALLKEGVETNTGVISANDFGRPCFPMIPYAQVALQGSRLNLEYYDSQQLSEQRGKDLALGGIYDHVGGGFHRYTVDSTWTVPHFEKMLYDNGQIVEYLADLWSAGIQEPAFQRAIAGTVEWLKREMTAPEGYFYAAQDADNFTDSTAAEPEEGAFYVWDYAALEEQLTAEELSELQEQFTVSPEGNFEGSNVLQRCQEGDLSENVKRALEKLFAARYGTMATELATFAPAQNNQEAKSGNWQGRIPPVTDTKMIVAWNSLMVSGLARAYGVFGDRAYLELATRAAHFILDRQWVNERLHRLNYDGKPQVLAQSEDYALFIKALLDLYSCSPQETHWLDKAEAVQAEFDEFFWSLEQGGYYNTATDDGQLLVRERSYVDNATPAANGVAIANGVRLAFLTENLDYLDRAEQGLQAFSSVMQQSPQACPSLFTALGWYLHGTVVRSSKKTLQTLIRQYFPTTAYRVDTPPNNAVGLVCQGLTCLEPSQSLEQILEQLRGRG